MIDFPTVVWNRWHKMIFPWNRISRLSDRYNKQTVAVMRRALGKDSNCVDVGCFQGIILKDMLQVSPDGRHYAFEPIPELFQQLVDTYPNARLYELALSDVAGESRFYKVVSNPGYSGFRKRKYDRPHEQIEEITVKTDLLDNIIPRHTPIHLVKIDVEGAELQVLRGAASVIRRNKPIIVFEHGLGAADCYGTTPEDIYDFLTRECGLRVSLMEKWLRDEKALEREEFAGQFYQHLNFYFMAHL